MKFCQTHWDALRTAVEERGLGVLISEGGERAAANLVSELNEGPTIDNFDPLMTAHLAIAANATRVIGARYMQSPALLFDGEPEHECPICCLNWLHRMHDEHCTQPNCNYPKGETYEWMIDRAVDDAAAEWKSRGAS